MQLLPLHVDDDHQLTLAFFDALRRKLPQSRLTMATGYFNCPDDYTNKLLAHGDTAEGPASSVEILTASAEANGFFGAKGVLGLVPVA